MRMQVAGDTKLLVLLLFVFFQSFFVFREKGKQPRCAHTVNIVTGW